MSMGGASRSGQASQGQHVGGDQSRDQAAMSQSEQAPQWQHLGEDGPCDETASMSKEFSRRPCEVDSSEGVVPSAPDKWTGKVWRQIEESRVPNRRGAQLVDRRAGRGDARQEGLQNEINLVHRDKHDDEVTHKKLPADEIRAASFRRVGVFTDVS